MSKLPDGLRNISSEVLSDNWYILRNYRFEQQDNDGEWQTVRREVFDRGNGAAILLYHKARQTIVLTRQFRLPSYLNGNDDGQMIEVPAGLLDALSPADAIAKEAMEETGYLVSDPVPVFDLFMSPGALTERIHLFVAEVHDPDRVGKGGGLACEHEQIEVLEMPFARACAMMADGRIRDAKTVILLQHAKIAGLFSETETKD